MTPSPGAKGPAPGFMWAQKDQTMDFELGEAVKVRDGTLTGRVVARTEYLHDAPQYLVSHLDKDGFAPVKSWFDEPALEAA